MAITNNIPQFDASDTNIGEAPSNGFSPNTTISSAQVNGAIRYSSFAISALLSAIGSITRNTGSYEYKGDGIVGFTNLKDELVTDLTDIIKQYTYDNSGTFTKLITHNDNLQFVKTSSSSPDIGIVYIGTKSSNHRHDIDIKSRVSYVSTGYSLAITCTDYNVPDSGLPSVAQVYGKLYLGKLKNSTDADVTFASGTYTLYPTYTHHIHVEVTPSSSATIKKVDLYLTTIVLGNNAKITTLNALRNVLDKADYNASGVVNINNAKWCPIYLLANGSTYSNPTILYLDNGSNTFTMTSSHSYTITDEVF